MAGSPGAGLSVRQPLAVLPMTDTIRSRAARRPSEPAFASSTISKDEKNVRNLTRRTRLVRSQARARDRPHRPSGRRRRLRELGRHDRARHRRRRQGAEARPGLLPADRPLPGEDLRRRPHSRRLSQARRPHVGPRDADLAPDRPADPAAVPRRVPLRHAGHRHRAAATTWRPIPTCSR